MPTDFHGLGGVYAGRTLAPRNIFTSYQSPKFAPGFAILDGTYSRDTGESPTSLIRAGNLLGKITASGKYRPSIIGVTHAAAASSATSVTVNAAVAAEIARLIALAGTSVGLTIQGPPTAGGTVAAKTLTVSAASGTTLTVSGLAAAMAAGSLIRPGDGSGSAITIATSEFGTDVTDRDGTGIDQPVNNGQGILIGADLLSGQIINFLTDDFGQAVDVSCIAQIKGELKAVGLFTFDDDR